MPVPQQAFAPIMSILGRPLTIGEEMRYQNAFEERMAIDTEIARVANERQKLQLEFEKNKQTAIAKAIELMMPRWERGGAPGEGQKVDVGMFQGREVAVGPGAPGREITPAAGPGVRYQEPTEQNRRQALSLLRPFVQVPDDPEAIFERQMEKVERQEELRFQREEARDIAVSQREEKRQEKITGRAEKREAAETLRAETAQRASEAKAIKLKFEDVLTGVHKEYTKQKNVVEADLTKTEDYRKAALEDLKDSYVATIGIVAKRAAKHGLDLDVEEFGIERDPSVLSRKQLDRYKAGNKKQKRAFAKWYEETYGKPLDIKVE